MTTHAVVLFYYPPAILNILTSLILGIEEQGTRYVGAFASNAPQQERGERGTPLRSQEGLGHAQTILLILLFALIVDRRLSNLMFEEPFVVVPGFLFFLVGSYHFLERID